MCSLPEDFCRYCIEHRNNNFRRSESSGQCGMSELIAPESCRRSLKTCHYGLYSSQRQSFFVWSYYSTNSQTVSEFEVR